MEEPVQHGQVLGWERMSGSSHRLGKAFICLEVPNWIRWRKEEALLMNNDLLGVKCSSLGERPIVLQ